MLFDTIKDLVSSGFKVTIEPDELLGLHYVVTVSKKRNNGSVAKKVSHLPKSDHFYEGKLVDCLKWSKEQVINELT